MNGDDVQLVAPSWIEDGLGIQGETFLGPRQFRPQWDTDISVYDVKDAGQNCCEATGCPPTGTPATITMTVSLDYSGVDGCPAHSSASPVTIITSAISWLVGGYPGDDCDCEEEFTVCADGDPGDPNCSSKDLICTCSGGLELFFRGNAEFCFTAGVWSVFLIYTIEPAGEVGCSETTTFSDTVKVTLGASPLATVSVSIGGGIYHLTWVFS